MAQASLNGKICLVTGATGFIGSYLCKELLKQGAIVKALIHTPTEGNWSSSFVCNLGKQKIPKEALEGVEIVFHLAGYAHSLIQRSGDDDLYHQINVEGTRMLLEAAREEKVKKCIFFSSVKSIGEENNLRLDETTEPKPLSEYGKSKLEAEKLLLLGRYVEFPTVLRMVMVYGNSNKGNLPKMIKAISKNWFPPFPKIKNKRSMIHVEDVIQGAVLAALSDVSSGEIYILSDGTDYSTRELYEAIRKAMGKKVPSWGIPLLVLQVAAKIGDILRFIIRRRIFIDSDNLQKLIGSSYYSSKKAVSELGFAPKNTLFDSLPNIISSIGSK